MNAKDLKELKISEDYVIAPAKFLAMFSINFGSIRHVNLNKLSQFTNYQILEASSHLVNMENVLKGDIFLVGNLYKFKAFHRPITEKLEDIIIVKDETKKEKPLSLYTLSELYQKLNDSIDSELYSLYLDEIYDRSYNNMDEELESNYQKVLVGSKKF